MGRKKRKNRKTRLDWILSLVSVGMLIATLVLDELDRRKRASAAFPEVDPDEVREEVREEMQREMEERCENEG